MKTTAKVIGVGVGTVHRWVTNGIEGKPRAVTSLPQDLLTAVKSLVQQHNHLTQHEIRAKVQDHLGRSLSRRCIVLALRKLGISRKRLRKRGYCNPARMAETVKQHCLRFAAIPRDTHVVSMDEVGFDQRMLPLYGYAPVGTKAIGTMHQRKRPRINAICAIDRHGQQAIRIVNGSVSGTEFASAVLAMPWCPGSIVLMDNCAIHKTKVVKGAFASKGYISMFIPPYSPDCNPIENVFSVVKNHFRKSIATAPEMDLQLAVHNSFAVVPEGMAARCFRRMEQHIDALGAPLRL
jgi:transposase